MASWIAVYSFDAPLSQQPVVLGAKKPVGIPFGMQQHLAEHSPAWISIALMNF